jgi:hypothetical protein
MSAAREHVVCLIVPPVDRLGDDFFRLKTRIAGEIIQKFVTYGVRAAIVRPEKRRAFSASRP